MYRIRKIFYPELFQGKYKKKNYFEGWYFKLIDPTMKHAIAVIPGVSIGSGMQDSHAFIQVLLNNNTVEIFRFHYTDFSYNEKKFEIRIANNYFSRDKIHLNLIGKDIIIKGKLSFYNIIKLPKTILKPGIMGYFSYIPFMECYHGIVNIHHNIQGFLGICQNQIDFTSGYGYIEKDWGKSFPKSWIWLQSNHFGEYDVSVMFSIADIPLFGYSFPGFISFIRLAEEIYVFATYTGAKLCQLKILKDYIWIVLKDRKYYLKIKVYHTNGGILKAPKNGFMKRDIIESINAKVEVQLTDIHRNIIFKGTGTNTGLEIM
ncbi:hypothetical protein I5677_12800 [Mobilitalea sibirica]|uniref:Tocopherol cyclase-like protein n=1 Tax=Mobilitalea sibirica TaxID=1462919 RepID=A0A8J7H5Q7_9FIRM|nr:tocopherol cyclase family protein [Mobilitalea sibirica]MBH1941774.1 hypothetical protein [Mobilitalea sibirica]